MAYELPRLPYALDALEPHIDARTMEIHHGKHHATYAANASKLVEPYPELAAKPIEQLLREIESVPADIRQAVINHGGGHANHSFFWRIMGPSAGGAPKGALSDDISKTFGGFEGFQSEFTKAATTRFGSGWAWLVLDENGKLQVCSTGNQDSPYGAGQKPLLALDVWEHAYYLKYQNRRPDYITAWWNTVNWGMVSELYASAKG